MTEWYDYVEYFFIGTAAAVGLAFIGVFGEYYVEILIGIGVILSTNMVIFMIFSVIGIIYFWAWVLEEAGVLDDNYIDSVLNIFFYEWYHSILAVDWIRVPIIYMEYLVTMYLGQNEFDPTDERFESLFMLLATPFLW